jgi:hypothetical protein
MNLEVRNQDSPEDLAIQSPDNLDDKSLMECKSVTKIFSAADTCSQMWFGVTNFWIGKSWDFTERRGRNCDKILSAI